MLLPARLLPPKSLTHRHPTEDCERERPTPMNDRGWSPHYQSLPIPLTQGHGPGECPGALAFHTQVSLYRQSRTRNIIACRGIIAGYYIRRPYP
jgi:hypothetical protein